VRYLSSQNNSESPKTVFLKDLGKAIQGWQEEGDTIIVVADMNEDVRSPSVQGMLRTVGLVDGPTYHHNRPPATHNCGSLPIDGIFVPMTLVDQCTTGYLTFGEALPSDHRALWLDLPAPLVNLKQHEAIEWPLARRLHCRDPQVVKKYNEVLWEALNMSGLMTRAAALQQQMAGQLTLRQQEEYKSIDKAATELKRHAEKQCRKIRVGAVQWCPLVSKAINRILYWKGLWSRLNRCAIGCLVLRQRAKEGGITNHQANFLLPQCTICESIRAAYKTFHRLKADPNRQDTWITNLIQAQAQAKGVKTKTLWKQHRATERARNTARLVWAALQSTNHSGPLQAVIGPSPEGERQEFSTKNALERACLEEAGRRFSQANDTPLFHAQFMKCFGEIGTNRPDFKKVLEGKFQLDQVKEIYVKNYFSNSGNRNRLTR